MDQLPADLPQETHQTYLGFLSSRPLTRELLTAKVRKYLDTICQASDEDQHLDIATSSDLGRGLLRLLRDCADEALPHVQAAIYYFVECEDAEPDLSSARGFEDDACVFNCVCRHVGLPELQISLI
jgi:hypothetical protein